MVNKKYIKRAIENELKQAVKEFPVLVLTGPRQTGKSTLLKKVFTDYKYVTLDNPMTRELAASDPVSFLTNDDKLIIDEIQYLPEILPYIKIEVDKDRTRNGRYLLTGSQYFPLMSGLTESLAGRISIYELLGVSTEETYGKKQLSNIDNCFEIIHKGFFPEVAIHNVDPNRFYSGYLQTYLERDIRQISSIQDLNLFQSFLELLAARVGNLLNLSEIAKECGISHTTAKKWLSLLETTRIIFLLRPYYKNISKRVVKSPKLYFSDTGLLSYILRFQNAETLAKSSHAGAFFENLVILEMIKFKFNHNENYELYFFRDSHHDEIDLIIDRGQTQDLIEIKKTATVRSEHFKQIIKSRDLFEDSKAYLVSFNQNKYEFKGVKSFLWSDWKKYLFY